MTLRHTITLSLAAAFIAGFAATAGAATTTTPAKPAKPMTHSHMHMVAAHGHMRTHATAPATGPDHSADALNAQSLSRAQGAK